jgi:CARDB
MVRRLAILLVLLAAAAAAGSPPTAARVDVALPASVRLLDCSLEDSSAEFYGRMRRIEDSERMWMRFRLLEKRLDRFEVLKAPGLSRWHRSKPGVGAFAYRQTVRGLQPGGLYRAQVSFRWYSGEGELVERTRRTSPACRQFEAVPNLTTAVLGAEPTKVSGVTRYSVRVSNEGVAPAADVQVRLSVDGAVVDTVTVAALAPGEERELAIRGPHCSNGAASLADPEGVIVESSESDNGDSVSCAELGQP